MSVSNKHKTNDKNHCKECAFFKWLYVKLNDGNMYRENIGRCYSDDRMKSLVIVARRPCCEDFILKEEEDESM